MVKQNLVWVQNKAVMLFHGDSGASHGSQMWRNVEFNTNQMKYVFSRVECGASATQQNLRHLLQLFQTAHNSELTAVLVAD